MSDEARLKRIEDKMDALVEAMADIRVLQEQFLFINKEQANQDTLIKKLDKEVAALEKENMKQNQILEQHLKRIDSLKWWVVMAFLACMAVLTGVNFL